MGSRISTWSCSSRGEQTGISSWLLGCQQVNPSMGSVRNSPSQDVGPRPGHSIPGGPQQHLQVGLASSPLAVESRIRVGCPEALSLCPGVAKVPKRGCRAPSVSQAGHSRGKESRMRSQGAWGSAQGGAAGFPVHNPSCTSLRNNALEAPRRGTQPTWHWVAPRSCLPPVSPAGKGPSLPSHPLSQPWKC